MSTAFSDVKPWPKAAPAAAVLGHNKPPIDEQIVIDLTDALSAEGLTKRIEDLIASAGRAPEITSDEIAGRYADLIKSMVTAGRAVEAEREKLNRPLLNAQRALKGRADAIVAPLAVAEKDARAKVKAFDDAEAEKERKRLADIAAKQREAQESAEKERLRLQAIEDEKAQKERDRLQAIEDERAATEKREATKVEVAAPVVEVEVAYVPATPAPARSVIQGDMGAKVARVTTWKHRVVSVRQLPDSILKHAKVIEALDKVIAAQVRGGTREMKGCEIFPETGTAIR
jgi:hypothetical protein